MTSAPAGEVEAYLSSLEPASRQEDARALCRLMGEATGEPGVLGASGMIDFGRYHYRYASGREGDAGLVAFAPRKQLVLYLAAYADDRYAEQLARLGPHKRGKGCLYVKRLADVDVDALRALVEESVRINRERDTQDQAGQ